MKEMLRRLATEEEGATAVEYGIIVALITVALIVVVESIGTNMASMFNTASSTLTSGS
jgi:pilus assembly protein Flp/PilA